MKSVGTKRVRKLNSSLGNNVFVAGAIAIAAGVVANAYTPIGNRVPDELMPRSPIVLGADERVITILATNDLHGAVEPSRNQQGALVGGLATFAGITRAIRGGLYEAYGPRAGVLVLDAGDQFQGTLLSNFSEGELMYRAMNEVGYDAVVPGNHAYDFGPQGWLEDQVTPTTTDQNPRGALLKIAGVAKFSLISANTYVMSSLVDDAGAAVAVEGIRCKPRVAARIEWKQARRPDFLKPYVIKNLAGVQVAMIGLDHPTTPQTTTQANVADLCFRDEAETYAEIVEEIGSRADIFVVVLHNGDAKNGFEGTELAKKLAARKQKPDVIIAGHTHFVNDLTVDGIPIVQSGANGRMYGRVDLIFDLKSRQVDRAKTRRMAGIPIDPAACPRESLAFCSADSASGRLAYEGAWMTPDADVEQLISDARKAIAPLADRRMGRAQGPLKPDRTRESNLANALTDVLRALSGAEVAFLNTGGIRTSIDAGDVTYEEFYRVLPFNNRGVLIAPMPIEKLFVLLERSIQTCGLYGALMQSGLRVEFERDCSAPVNQTDPKARLLRVETLAGEVLLDRSQGVTPPAGRTFQVATLDFLHAGGSGFSGFVGVPLVRELGLAREAMVEYFLKTPADFSETLDGRWKELPRAPSAP